MRKKKGSYEETEAGWITGTYSRSQVKHSCVIPGQKQVLNQEARICNLALVYFWFSNHAHAVHLLVHTFSTTLVCTLQQGVTADEESLLTSIPGFGWSGKHCFSRLQSALWSGS